MHYLSITPLWFALNHGNETKVPTRQITLVVNLKQLSISGNYLRSLFCLVIKHVPITKHISNIAEVNGMILGLKAMAYVYNIHKENKKGNSCSRAK